MGKSMSNGNSSSDFLATQSISTFITCQWSLSESLATLSRAYMPPRRIATLSLPSWSIDRVNLSVICPSWATSTVRSIALTRNQVSQTPTNTAPPKKISAPAFNSSIRVGIRSVAPTAEGISFQTGRSKNQKMAAVNTNRNATIVQVSFPLVSMALTCKFCLLLVFSE